MQQRTLCSNCNQRCFRRKFGKGETDLDVAPTGLEKYGSELPLWFLSLDGVDKPLELETEDCKPNTFSKTLHGAVKYYAKDNTCAEMDRKD